MTVIHSKLIFLVTEDWYFHMHRLPQARAAREAGFEVCVATRLRAHGTKIEAEGFRLIPLGWKRGSLNPFAALRDIVEIACMYRRECPDIVHHVSLKSVLLGTIAARVAALFPLDPVVLRASAGSRAGAEKDPPLAQRKRRRAEGTACASQAIIVNAFTGLGLLFLGATVKIRLLRLALFPLLRWALRSRRVHVLTENHDHLDTLLRARMIRPRQGTVIRGSGIDIDYFHVLPEPAGAPTVACAARMLRSKGILVLAEAMRLLENRSPLRLLLAGVPDPESSDSLSDAEMRRIAAQPNIEWLGRIETIRDLWGRAHIGVLPSITGEGLPVGLMEAASCGRPLVTTDVAGCREIVSNGANGLLVPAEEPAALAEALQRLAADPDLRARYGAASRRMVESELSAVEVGARTVTLYNRLLETDE